jgi:hypothetical protein
MSDWVKWVIVALGLVLILALLAYARGERQRGEPVSTRSTVTILAGQGTL